MLKFPYQEAMGALMWMATMTRPDIASTVRVVLYVLWPDYVNLGPAHYFKTGM